MSLGTLLSLTFLILMFVTQIPLSSTSDLQQRAGELVTYEDNHRETRAFVSEENEPLLLFILGLIILLIATGLRSELARKPSSFVKTSSGH